MKFIGQHTYNEAGSFLDDVYVEGNVGIGTASPARKLEVESSDATLIKIQRTAALNANIQYTNATGSMYAGLSDVSGANVWGVGTGQDLPATPLLLVAANGKVGIGIGTPTSLLHVNIDTDLGASVGDLQDFVRLSGDTTHNDTLTTSLIRSSTAASGASHESAQWRIQRKIDATWASWINFGGEEGSGTHNHGLSFGVGSSTSDALSVDEVMRIEPTTGGGNVGIGTTAPGALLHVQASATSYSWTPYAGTVAILEGTESNHSILSIVGSTYSSIWFGDAGDQNMGRIRYTHTDDTMQFYTNNAERAVIDENGSLGLGTSDPEALLHLQSAGDTALIIRADLGNSGENDNPLIHLQQDFVAAGTNGVMVDSKIGIVGNAGQIFTNSLANAAYITNQGSITTGSADTGIIQFATGGNNGQDTDEGVGGEVSGVLASARMTILADGSVGIGTTTPTAGAGNLTVAGDLAVSGDTVTFESANSDDPHIIIKNTFNGTDNGARLDFKKLRADNATEQGLNCGEIHFTGEDNAGNVQDYAYIIGEIDVGTDGQESGQIVMGVANHDGGSENGLVLTGGASNQVIDVTLGSGAASTTTTAGDLTVTGDVVMMANLPTSDPSNTGQLWNDSGTLKVS